MGNQIGAGSRSLGVFSCARGTPSVVPAVDGRDRPAACSRGITNLAAIIEVVSKPKEPFNVFYALLLVVGVAFALTAFAYFVMAARARHTVTVERSGLMHLLSEQGGTILAIELGILALCTIGAIGWDHVVGQRRARRSARTDETNLSI